MEGICRKWGDRGCLKPIFSRMRRHRPGFLLAVWCAYNAWVRPAEPLDHKNTTTTTNNNNNNNNIVTTNDDDQPTNSNKQTPTLSRFMQVALEGSLPSSPSGTLCRQIGGFRRSNPSSGGLEQEVTNLRN